jgi:hypothetical protein
VSRKISGHLNNLAKDATPDAARQGSIHVLLNILGEDQELATKLQIVQGLAEKVDVSIKALLIEHLESIQDEAGKQGREDLERQAVQLLNDLEGNEE